MIVALPGLYHAKALTTVNMFNNRMNTMQNCFLSPSLLYVIL